MSLLIRIVLDKSPVCETLIFVQGKHLGRTRVAQNEQKNKRKPVTVGGVRGNYSKKYNKIYF